MALACFVQKWHRLNTDLGVVGQNTVKRGFIVPYMTVGESVLTLLYTYSEAVISI